METFDPFFETNSALGSTGSLSKLDYSMLEFRILTMEQTGWNAGLSINRLLDGRLQYVLNKSAGTNIDTSWVDDLMWLYGVGMMVVLEKDLQSTSFGSVLASLLGTSASTVCGAPTLTGSESGTTVPQIGTGMQSVLSSLRNNGKRRAVKYP